jgi:hypothetical protein
MYCKTHDIERGIRLLVNMCEIDIGTGQVRVEASVFWFLSNIVPDCIANILQEVQTRSGGPHLRPSS